jgi:hypothetical protein
LVRRGERVTSSVTLAPAAVSHPAVNPWYVATAVIVPTFMEIVDTTIATASLRYTAGGGSPALADSSIRPTHATSCKNDSTLPRQGH